MKTMLMGLLFWLAAVQAGAATPSPLDSLLPVRGFCIAAPRPSGLDSFLVFVRQELAPRHVNTLILRVDYHYAFATHPELVDSFALSKAEVKEIVRTCREAGIRVIPQINLLGHQSFQNHLGRLLAVYPQLDETPWIQMPAIYAWPNADRLYCKSYCPLHPDVHKLLFEVIDELCDVFEANAFHAGMDEVFYLGEQDCPRCKGRDKAELFADEVRSIHDHLAEKGRELWMWGDRLLDGRTTGIGEWEASYNDTYRAVDLIPKDVVICDWHYERADYTPVYFAMKGFRVIMCPFRKPFVATAELDDMLRFRSQSTKEMRDRFLGVAQTVWSNTSVFLLGFYGLPMPQLPPGARPYDPVENPWNCFRTLYDSIGAKVRAPALPGQGASVAIIQKQGGPRSPAFTSGGPKGPRLNAISVRSINPSDTDFSDLAGMRKAIGDARIVLLGEQTHGEGSTFEAKTRLVKFLHERMGFDVLAFESGLYDCARIWENVQQGASLKKEVVGSLFYMYATSLQTQDLFAYVQAQQRAERPLTLTGFDSQHTGEKAKTDLFPDFTRFLNAHYPVLLDSSWNVFQKVSLGVFGSRDFKPAPGEKDIFIRELATLKRVLKEKVPATETLTDAQGFWYEVACSIESQALRYWGMAGDNPEAVRDAQMAANLIWLAEHAYEGKKIIVWAHNVHVAKDLGSLAPVTGPKPDMPHPFIPMGHAIRQHFGRQAYVIGFSGDSGTYMDFTNSKILTVTPRAEGSVEAVLAAEGYTFAFLNYRNDALGPLQIQTASLADYRELNGDWASVFDGLFFIRNVLPVNRL